jgi:aspartate aminotransferase
MVVAELNQIDGIICKKSVGAFYLFPNCEGLFGRKTPNGTTINNSADFCAYLLEVALVAAVHGSAFGTEGYFRISYATSEAQLVEACKRIKTAVQKLK